MDDAKQTVLQEASEQLARVLSRLDDHGVGQMAALQICHAIDLINVECVDAATRAEAG